MKCLICGKTEWKEVFSYHEPDKYEKWCGIEDVFRNWMKCKCGHYQSRRNYSVEKLNKIYRDGYRSKSFRGETIRVSFNRVAYLPDVQREAHRRLMYFITCGVTEQDTILDFGSGFGIWPYELVKNGYDKIVCTEINKDSLNFINKDLSIKCVEVYDGPKVDVISLIHVLEHFEDPIKFIIGITEYLKPDGKLFIEVPDAFEFGYLPKEHDEFNSCHIHFFDGKSLFQALHNAGFRMTDFHRECYFDRNLTRIMAMAERH